MTIYFKNLAIEYFSGGAYIFKRKLNSIKAKTDKSNFVSILAILLFSIIFIFFYGYLYCFIFIMYFPYFIFYLGYYKTAMGFLSFNTVYFIGNKKYFIVFPNSNQKYNEIREYF